MPLKKLVFKAGVNKENTRYLNENGWYSCDKVRFRQGTPEKIGGWQAIAPSTYLGICRSLWAWSSLAGSAYLGLGTNLKYYIYYGGAYYDITPIASVTAPGAITFSAVTIAPYSTTITVNHTGHGATVGTSVRFSGVAASGLGGAITQAILQSEFQITSVDPGGNTYTITAPVSSNASDTGNGGASVVGTYQVNAGGAIALPLTGWGAGYWGGGGWGVGLAGGAFSEIRIWNHQNFGEDLIFGPKNGSLYYWDATTGLVNRGVALSSLAGASDVPTIQAEMLVSDASRFVLAFGCNDYGSAIQDPMLIRWSDQESAVNWTPAATNQAGSLRLSHGSKILSVAQVRQEILVWTDTSLYSLQYLGPPVVWGSQLLADNVFIVSDRASVNAAGVTYWMGDKKFYTYDGRVNALDCDLRQFVFGDFNFDQADQVFATTNQQFNEVWWFYCSASSTTIDRYVVYNYLEKIWYYGTMPRTAWIDSTIVSTLPIAATYANNLVYQETGTDDLTSVTPVPIEAYITSSEFDIDDGDRFGFVWRVLPDMTFRGSSAAAPSATLTLLPLQNSGSGYTRGTVSVPSVDSDMSVAGENSYPVVRSATVPIEAFTQQVNIRVRGRQMSLKVASTGLGVQWQLGACRLDIRQDGRKS